MSTATPTSPATNPGSASRAPSTPGRRTRILRRYQDGEGATRELLLRPGAEGTALVVDRDLLRRGEQRLVAHLAADEPPDNAALAVAAYLGAEPGQRGCRELQPEDTEIVPLPAPCPPARRPGAGIGAPVEGVDGSCAFRLLPVPSGMSIPALRWTCAPPGSGAVSARPVSLREAIGRLERYEPLAGLTRDALALHEDDPAVSTTVLRAELRRVLESPIVLNRGLREAVLAKVSGGEVSMSEIAMRCGRLKRSKGHITGETSWLARRVGLLPEGGHSEPTRWVHSDVLALIARQGLGIAPREVELG